MTAGGPVLLPRPSCPHAASSRAHRKGDRHELALVGNSGPTPVKEWDEVNERESLQIFKHLQESREDA